VVPDLVVARAAMGDPEQKSLEKIISFTCSTVLLQSMPKNEGA
jgi:hypothetical protein